MFKKKKNYEFSQSIKLIKFDYIFKKILSSLCRNTFTNW